VTDYKTGAPASIDEVQAGFDPQLPLTAYVLAQGGVKGQGSADVEQLNYVRLKGSGAGHDLVSPLTPPAKKGWPAPQYAQQAYDE